MTYLDVRIVVRRKTDGLYWAGQGVWTANELRALIFSSVMAASHDAPTDDVTFWVEGDDGKWRQVVEN